MNWNLIRKVGCMGILIGLLYTSYNAIIGFYSGFHNLDSSFNYLHLGLNQDINTDGVIRSLKDTYLLGLNQMKSACMWLVFDVILGIVFGYLLKRGEK